MLQFLSNPVQVGLVEAFGRHRSLVLVIIGVLIIRLQKLRELGERFRLLEYFRLSKVFGHILESVAPVIVVVVNVVVVDA